MSQILSTNSSGGGGNITTIETANATPQFVTVGSVSTVDFGIDNLLLGSDGAITSGTDNVGYGQLALAAITSGIRNTGIGFSALADTTSGNRNIGLGAETLGLLTSGTFNIAIGDAAGDSLRTGTQNVLIGTNAGTNYTGAESNNILIGYNVVGTLGDDNTIQIGNGSSTTCFIQGIASVVVSNLNVVTINTATGQLGSTVLTAGTNVSISTAPNQIIISANATSYTENYTGITHASSPYSATASDYYIGADVTLGVITVYLPAAPVTGRALVIKDRAGLAATSNITVTTLAGIVTIDGATTAVMNNNYQSIQVIYNGTSWEIY